MEQPEARKLSAEELRQISAAQQRWKPVIFQTYQTKVVDMMASPIKWPLVKSAVPLTAFLLYVLFILKVLKKKSDKMIHLFYLAIFGVVILVSIGMSVYRQYRLNKDLELVMTFLPEGATKYDYESSPVIQNQMLRGRIGGRGGGALAGGLVGGLIGSRRR